MPLSERRPQCTDILLTVDGKKVTTARVNIINLLRDNFNDPNFAFEEMPLGGSYATITMFSSSDCHFEASQIDLKAFRAKVAYRATGLMNTDTQDG